MKKMKINSLESLKNDLFQEEIIEGFNIRGGYGTYRTFYTNVCGILYYDHKSD